MRRCSLGLAIASLLPIGMPAPAQNVPPQKWQLEVDNGWCKVSTGDPHKGFLSLQVTPGANQSELFIVGPTKLVHGDSSDTDVKVKVIAGSETFDLEGERFLGRIGGTTVVRLSGLAPDFLTALTHTTAIQIEGLPGPVTVPTRGAIVAVNGLASCGDKLLGEWGIDPARFHSLRQPPELTSNDWFTDTDFPLADQEFAKQGGGVARVDVDASGKVTNCVIAATSGYGPIDKVICARLLSKAKFAPAIDSDGQPTAASQTVRMEFEVRDF